MKNISIKNYTVWHSTHNKKSLPEIDITFVLPIEFRNVISPI